MCSIAQVNAKGMSCVMPIDSDIVKILIGNMPLNGNLGYYNLDAIKQSETQEVKKYQIAINALNT